MSGDGHIDLAIPNSASDEVTVLLGNGDGSFEDQHRFAVVDTPLTVRVADVNNDGHTDLITVNVGRYDNSQMRYLDGSLSVLLGRGDGTFEDQYRFAVGNAPLTVQVMDLNGDGHVDLIAPNTFTNDVSVLLGRGDGTFEDQRRFIVGTNPKAVQVVDVNRDGRFDLVVLNGADISVLLGHADGTFEGQRRFAVGDNPQTVQVVDMNGDGRLDLVTPNKLTADVSVLLGRGDGTFQDRRRFAVGGFPGLAQAVDVNGDGRIDLVTPNEDSDDVSVLMGRDDGTFENQLRFTVGDSPMMVQVVDVNNDGRVDLITPNRYSNDVSLLLGRGDGTFEEQRRFAAGDQPLSVQVIDVNGDGRVDLVIANSFTDDVSVRLGHGDGTFENQRRFAAGDSPQTVAVVDVNGDGRADIVTANEFSADVSVLLGRVDGTYKDQLRFTVGFEPITVLAVDVNGDGHVDLVTANLGTFDNTLQEYVGGDDVSLLLGRGDGTFESQLRFVVGDRPQTVVAIDVNGDGHIDLVTANTFTDDVSVLLGHGDGTFEDQILFAVGGSPQTVQVADVNDDGHVDLITPNDSSDDVSVLLGLGDGMFEDQRRFAAGDSPQTVFVVDVNGDDRVDLVATNYYKGDASVLLGDHQGDFVNALSVSPITVGTRPVVEDINGDGITDVLVLRQDGAVLYRQGTRASHSETGQSVAMSLGEFRTAVVLNPDHPARDFAVLRTPQGIRIAALSQAVDKQGRQVITFFQYRAPTKGNSSSFRPVRTLPIGGSLPARIVAGNFDQDRAGRDDFAVINQGDQTVSLFLADRNGFHLAETIDAGAGPVSLTTTDVNRDGLTDLIVPNFGSGDVSVFTNIGEGHFATSLFRTGAGPYFIGSSSYDSARIESQSFEQTSSAEVGDFNGDRLPDLIASNPGSNSWSILYGTALGLSSDPVVTLLASSPSRFAAVRVADVDHDGHDDAVFLNESGTQLSVYLNSGGRRGIWSLNLNNTMDLPTLLTGFILHDANGDGRPDIFATNEFGDLLLLINKGTGQFEEYRRADRSIPIAVQDLNGDGKSDVVLANQSLDQVSIDYGGAEHPTALQELASRDNGVAAPGAVKLADLNGDGVADLIVPNTGGNSVLIYKGHVGAGGRVDGTFESGESIFTGSNPTSVTVNDLDQDGHMDLVVTNRGSNTVAIFYGQSAVDSQTMSGATAIPFRAGALSKLPSGSGPVDAQVVSLKNADGSTQTGLVVTNSTSNSVSFIPSAGNGIFNQTPSNTIPLGFSPLPGVVVGDNLVLPNPGGNSLGFVALSAANFNGSQPGVSLSLPLFDHPIGIDASADVNHDGLVDLLVANNGDGSVSLLLGDGHGFDFSQSFFLDGITHASALRVAGFDLYVTEEGKEFFTKFDLDRLRLEKGELIIDFEAISGSVISTVASSNRPVYGLGLFSPLLFAMFGQFPLEEEALHDSESLVSEPTSWQSLVLIVTQLTLQFDRLSETFENGWLVSTLETLSTGLGLSELPHKQASPVTFETFVTSLSIWPGTQPLTQLVRSLQSLWSNRPNGPASSPAGSSTSPPTKTPFKDPTKMTPSQSSAIPNGGAASETAIISHTDSISLPSISAVQISHIVQQSELTTYMAQLAADPYVSSELFDDRLKSPQEASLESIAVNIENEFASGWCAFASSAVVSSALTEPRPYRSRDRRSEKMTVG